MKTRHFLPLINTLLLICTLTSCKKEEVVPTKPSTPAVAVSPYDPLTVTGLLKDATDIPLGVAVTTEEFNANGASYANIVKNEFDNVTFGYHMKHGSIVRNNGDLDFTRCDALVNLAGLPIFGHVLAWHQNNNGDYLRSLATGASSNSSAPNLLINGDFEQGTGNTFTDWVNLVGGNSEGSFSVETNDTEPNTNSKKALKVTVTKAGTNAYDMQSLGPSFTAVVGKQYRVSASIKAVSGRGRLKLVLQNTAYTENQLNFTTNTWVNHVWNVTLTEPNPQFKLHYNGEGIYLIDNIKIEDVSLLTPPTNAEITKKVDAALKTWVQANVSRYKEKVKAWDAINEVYTDGVPTLRTGSSTGDTYYWAQYLGRSYIAKTFRYAREVNPDCDLFVNDYNLEINTAKLDSTIGLVKELLAQNVPVTGIGTQMHMSINTPRAGIISMFQKMAATGLKVRVSELDISINPSNSANFVPTKALFEEQAAMFEFVVKSYIQYVPAAQRHGITVWGVSDKDSWITPTFNRPDNPLIWDANLAKKPAYVGFYRGLK
jgi:endo-1,4-beta-xylanase